MKIVKLGAILLICALMTAFFSELSFVSDKTEEMPDGEIDVIEEKTDYSVANAE